MRVGAARHDDDARAAAPSAEARPAAAPLEIDPALQGRLAAQGLDVRLADARTFPYDELRAGRPAQVSLQNSSGFGALDESALAAVRAAKFRPYTEAGQAQPVWVSISIRFKLQ